MLNNIDLCRALFHTPRMRGVHMNSLVNHSQMENPLVLVDAIQIRHSIFLIFKVDIEFLGGTFHSRKFSLAYTHIRTLISARHILKYKVDLC